VAARHRQRGEQAAELRLAAVAAVTSVRQRHRRERIASAQNAAAAQAGDQEGRALAQKNPVDGEQQAAGVGAEGRRERRRRQNAAGRGAGQQRCGGLAAVREAHYAAGLEPEGRRRCSALERAKLRGVGAGGLDAERHGDALLRYALQRGRPLARLLVLPLVVFALQPEPHLWE